MRSMQPVPALLLVAASLCQPSLPARAQDEGVPGERYRTGREVRELLAARSHVLRTSAGADPDTVYVGKSYSNHTAPDNYWNLYVGTYRPGTNAASNALWNWDNNTGIQAPDSLQGWWPYEREYLITGGVTLTDDQRPWWCVDHGNVGNYVIPAGSAAKRTFGVVGYWHDDPGVNAGQGVRWSPLSGNRSAWCGMRQHGDLAVKDLVTGNYYSGEAVSLYGESGAGTQLVKRLPGYLDQMDQMLYRDIAVPPGQSLAVSFLYRTRMSTSIGTAAATRTGWFHGDPLAVTAGNFISSSAAGANAPQDSFMVYVGAPVNDAACVYSDGVTRPVYDKQRRWFSEVIQVFGGASYYEIFARAGDNPLDTLAATPSASATVPAASIANILASSPTGVVRLVFRVKTNRFFSDGDSKANGYSSLGRGAAQVDDVTIDRGSGPELIGDFETPQQGGVNAIDNRFPLPAGLAVTDVWRSTGKPAPVYMHVQPLSGLVYNDICGPPNAPQRFCNLSGNVMVAGNHDLGESFADARFAAFHEARTFMMSPTINLVGGPGGTPNSQGITTSIAHVSDDYVLWYDLYWGPAALSFSGLSWNLGYQAYPSLQTGNGGKSWSDRHYYGGVISGSGPECFTDFEGFANDMLNPITTSNPSGVPDSLRVLLGAESQCFRFAVTLGCNSSEGIYFDNVSLAFVDVPGVPGQASALSTVNLGTVSSNTWDFVNDTFPANETAGLPGTAAFDTTTALIRAGVNTAQFTTLQLGDRFDIPGDSSRVTAFNASIGTADDPALVNVRVDFVFRILPGPGNYQIAAGRSMAPGGRAVSGVLLKVPTNQAAPAVAGDASFWGQYMAAPGDVSAGTHGGPGGWDPLVWNSCRMDTAQNNVFPVGFTAGPGLTAGRYMTCIHESDPKFLTLGVDKFRCFVIDTTKGLSSSPTLDNASCNGVVPAWLNVVPRSRTGWDGLATTKECTKIIPDGLLTPGSHVQYFYRKSHASDPFLNYAMCPDTNLITPQAREGTSTDMHRWQQFGVLPDRWKNAAFGGAGMACMLYVDMNDARGNEGRFVSVMDTIGGTAPVKWGAHNGWHARGDVNVNGLDVRTNMSVAVSDKNSQPGTTWDMYGVKGLESSPMSAGNLGSRLANRTNMGFAAGRESRQGPTPEMLRAYYRILVLLTGDLTSGLLGPFLNRSQNDIAILSDFLAAAGGTPQPRGLLIQGDGFGQSEQATGTFVAGHTQFLAEKLGVILRGPSYRALSGQSADCADLLMTTAITVSADVYGVVSSCNNSNDVWQLNPAVPEAVPGATYESVGGNGPYIADVVKTAVPTRNWVAVTSGYDIEHLMSRYCDTSGGRLAYYYYMIHKTFGSICQCTCDGFTLDTPNSGRGRDVIDFLKIGNALMRHDPASVRFGNAKAGRVQIAIYDVAGRKVRDLADRVFPAGEHELRWDGTDDAGHPLGRGVYFVRSSTQKDSKRIIVLNR